MFQLCRRVRRSHGRQPLPIAALAACLALSGGCDQAGEAEARSDARPMIVVGAEATQDLGVVFTGEMLYRQVPVANHGDAPLEFGAISSSCTCAQASMTKARLEPGEEGALLYTYRAGQTPGPDLLRIAVDTNDPEVPSLFIEARASVVAGLVTEPTRVDTMLQPGERREIEVRWRSDRWTIEPRTAMYYPVGVEQTTQPRKDERGVSIGVTLYAAEDVKPGLIETWVALRMHLIDPQSPDAPPEERTVTIPIVITVPPE